MYLCAWRRQLVLQDCLPEVKLAEHFTINHPLIEMCLADLHGVKQLRIIDWLHIGWRLR